MMSAHRPAPICLWCFVMFLLAWHGSPSAAQSADYRIGARDLVELKVLEAPDFDQELRINDDGIANHPILGELRLGGRTRAEAITLITDALEERYLQKGRATVSLDVSEVRSRAINVIGAVKSPGELEFSGRWTLVEALTAAGGLTQSHGNIVYVIRRANGLTDQIEISLDDLLVRADPTVNLPLSANDLVNVPETIDVTLYCLGEVQSPGPLVFKSNERITLLTAIARAGGLTDRAARKIHIQRQDRSGRTEQIVVDYRAIVSGRQPDVELERGDVINVKQSFL